MTHLQLWLCGGFRCRVDGQELTAPPRRDAARLLSLLALAAPVTLSRSEAAAALWPTLSPERARPSLRLILHSLQQYLAQTGAAASLLSQADGLGWVPGLQVWVDLRQTLADADSVIAANAAGPRCELPSIPAGELPDWSDAWFVPWRNRFDAARAELLGLSGAAKEVAGDRTGAQQDSRRLLALRPTDEAANLRLLRLLLADGDRAGARRQLQLCLDAYDDDLGREPSPAFLAAADQLLGSVSPASFTESAEADPALHSLPTVDAAERLERLQATLAQHRLLLVLGPAGCGKSRLLERLRPRLEPLLWVDLAQAPDKAAPLDLLTEALLLAPQPAPPWLLIDHAELAPPEELERLLLLLLRSDEGPRVILAGRQPLGLRGAHRWQLALDAIPPFLQEAESLRLLGAVWRDRPPPPDLTAAWSPLAAALSGRPLALLVAADRLRRAGDPAAAAAALIDDPSPLLLHPLAGSRFASLADSLAADARWLSPGQVAALRSVAAEARPLCLSELVARIAPEAGGEDLAWDQVQVLIQAGLLLPTDNAGEPEEPRYGLDLALRCYWRAAASGDSPPLPVAEAA